MTEIDRERRLSAAIAELEEFCKIFRFKLMWEYADSDPCAYTTLNVVQPGSKCCVVLRERARRDYRGIGYSSKYAIAERLLSKIRRGVTLFWQWEESRPTERGKLTIRYTRLYRVPKFTSVAALKIQLAAEGSEFAS